MSDESQTGYGLSSVNEAASWAAPVYASLPQLPPGPLPPIALIGAGGISEYHLRAYRALGLDVTWICDRHLDRAESRRQAFYPKAAICERFQDVLADPQIQIVDITTHPEDRHPIVSAALAAGKHVLCQKPFVLDLDAGKALVKLADDHGVQLAVNQNGRWAPHFRYLLETVRAGLLGPIASVDFTAQWDHTWTATTAFNDIHHLLLYDFGIHWFDMATALMAPRPAQSVFAAVSRTSFQAAKPPFLAQVAIDYGDAQVRIGFNAHVIHGQEDRTVVSGQNGTARAWGPSLNDQRVQLWTERGTAIPELPGCWFDNGFQGTMAELIASIKASRDPSNSARGNLDSLQLCFAAIRSADTGLPVDPSTVRRL